MMLGVGQTIKSKSVLFAVIPGVLFFAAADSFSATCAGPGERYEIRGSAVYFDTGEVQKNSTRVQKKLDDVDVSSFKVMDSPHSAELDNKCGLDFHYAHYYARDKKSVFFKGELIPKADPGSFQFVNEFFAKDNNHVFYQEKKISDKPNLFKILDDHGPSYAFDGDKYFYETREMGKNGFRFVDGSDVYTEDARFVYHDGVVVKGADPKSFVLYKSSALAKDKSHVFSDDKVIPGVDAASFRQLDNSVLFRDKSALYYAGDRLGNVDPDSAHLSQLNNYVVDAHKVYSLVKDDSGKVSAMEMEGRDASTFVELSANWEKDSRHVYFKDEIFDQADLESFHLTDAGIPEDKNYRYRNTQKLCKFDRTSSARLPDCDGNAK